MVIRSFRSAHDRGTINECLLAACTLSSDRDGRLALLRHGMLEAIQQAVVPKEGWAGILRWLYLRRVLDAACRN